MLLAVLLLISCLFLLRGLADLGVGRVHGEGDARTAAFQDATIANPPIYAPDPAPQAGINTDPLPGYTTLRPGLPLRMHVARLANTISVTSGVNETLAPVTLHSSAAVPSPAWALDGFPDTADQADVQTWFTNYADESTATIRNPLDLAAPWSP